MIAPESLISVACGDLLLEGRLREGTAPLALLMLHPHPQMGGDMDNPVVVTICAAAAELEVTTLRLNFRGVGASQGTYDGGAGEQDDARTGLAQLRALQPDAALVLAGYSFGAMVASRIAATESIAGLLLVSPAATRAADLPPNVPALILCGADDGYMDSAALATEALDGHRVILAPGVDHFWWGAGDLLARESAAFLSTFAAQL